MPFSNFTNLDFDQIKTSIKDYLRANSNFTDFDFDGSNFSVLIDTLAYNTYITAFNSNMVVNESFLDSATLRQNVVSLANNIGYTPRSKTAANAQISFDVQKTNVQIAIYSKNTDEYQIIARANLFKNGKKKKQVTAKGTAREISTATLLIDEGGKFSQANVSTALKKVCIKLIDKLKI